MCKGYTCSMNEQQFFVKLSEGHLYFISEPPKPICSILPPFLPPIKIEKRQFRESTSTIISTSSEAEKRFENIDSENTSKLSVYAFDLETDFSRLHDTANRSG